MAKKARKKTKKKAAKREEFDPIGIAARILRTATKESGSRGRKRKR